MPTPGRMVPEGRLHLGERVADASALVPEGRLHLKHRVSGTCVCLLRVRMRRKKCRRARMVQAQRC